MFEFDLFKKFRKGTFQKGVHLKDNKSCADKKIKQISLPKEFVIPLSQSIGAESVPIVKVGEMVRKYQVIAEPKGVISSYIHSPVSGVVTNIKKLNLINNKESFFVCISAEGDNFNTEEDLQENQKNKIKKLKEKKQINPRKKERIFEELDNDELIDIIRKAGIVGMGGAGFPTDVKLNCKNKKIDTFILNGCECEPYITADDRVMIENSKEVVLGMQIMMKIVGAKKGYIGIEDNKAIAFKSLNNFLEKKKIRNILLKKVKTKYPQGAEGMLIYSILGMKIPKSRLPADYGVVVNNVSTAKAVYDAVYGNIPLVQRVVTVVGSIKNEGNYIVPIGISMRHIVEELGGLIKSPNLIVSGGPMMGVAQENLDMPITKTTSCLLFLEQKTKIKEENCINCGACVNVCPMNLMPLMFAKITKKKKYNLVKEYYIDSCFECGSCASVCPSKIPIVQYIRVVKDVLRKEEKK
jgi:Na+-translocating ferredoxin:NAD+ oxidoreductase subunit C